MNESIETARELMELNDRIFNADLADIAFQFDRILGHAEPNRIAVAIDILLSLVTVYLRGRGYRIGNSKAWKAHGLKFAWVATAVIAKIEERGRFWYPNASKAGLESLESAVKGFYTSCGGSDIVKEAEDILRRKGGEND